MTDIFNQAKGEPDKYIELVEFLARHFLSLENLIKGNKETADQRFDKMDQRFDKMDERFDKMDLRFDRLELVVLDNTQKVALCLDKLSIPYPIESPFKEKV